jgi:transposase
MMNMEERLIHPQRRQRVLLPESLDELLALDHPVRLLAAVVEQLNMAPYLSSVKSVSHRAGRPALEPSMLLAWLYATSRGIGSAREMERLSTTDLAFRWIFGGVSVKKSTLAEFRVAHLSALETIFTAVIAKLVEAGAVNVDFVAIDGMRVRADAGQSSYRHEPSLVELREQAALHVKAGFSQADDRLVSVQVKRAREAKAKDLLARADAALAAVRELKGSWEQKTPSQRSPKPPRVSGTDPAAHIMKQSHGGFGPGYNARIAIAGDEDGGPRTVVGIQVTSEGTDRGGITPVLDDVERRTREQPKVVVADEGFLKTSCIETAHTRGTALCVPMTRAPSSKTKVSPAIAAWQKRMGSDDGKRALRIRPSLAELPFAFARERFGLRRLPVRGPPRVKSALLLVFLTFNILQHAATLSA